VKSARGSDGTWLEGEVARVYGLLGADTRRRLLIEHYEIDVWARFKKGPFTITHVIECKEKQEARQVTTQEMTHFGAKVTAAKRVGKADKGVFVTTSGFTKHARASAAEQGIQCLTLRELLNQIVDFEPYLNAVVQEFDSSHLAKWYVDQTLSEFEDYEGLTLADRHQALHSPALTHVETVLEGSQENRLALLGNFGTGKSTLCRVYRAALARKALKSCEARVPVLLDLREFRVGLDIQQVIVSALLRLPGVDINPKVCLELQRGGRFLFLLDGLDEMASRIDRGVINDSLREIDSLRSAGDNQYLITCRTHFFQERVAEEFLTDYRVLYLTEWGTPELRIYFQKRFGEAGDSRCARLLANPRIAELARTPLLLDILLETDDLGGEHLNVFGLLNRYTDNWITQQSRRRGAVMPAAQRRRFVLTLAQHMRLQGVSHLHFSELYEVAREFCGHSDASRIDHFDADARTCTFVTRDSQGNYSFRYQTFFDFFSADTIAGTVESGERKLLEAFELTPEIIELMVGRSISQIGLQHLHDWSRLFDTGRLSQNAMRLLCALDETPHPTVVDHYQLTVLEAKALGNSAAAEFNNELAVLADLLLPDARQYVRDVGLPKTDADDIVNEVLARVWRKLQRDPAALKGVVNLHGYLKSAMRNLIYDWKRARWREFATVSIDNVDVTKELEGISAQLDADREIQLGEIRRVIDQLPWKERQIVGSAMQGASIAEVAQRMNLTTRTVRVLLSSALRRVRAALDD
jgi:RNA polymerase sigma factor (sigma-70 family)